MSSLQLFSLAGQNVLVTGATRGTYSTLRSEQEFSILPLLRPGIGAACAIALVQAGASVILVHRPPDDGMSPNLETYNAILANGGTAHVVYCDLSDVESVRSLFQKALDVIGGQIHVLVNCAGIQRRSPSVDFSAQDWDDVWVPFINGGSRSNDSPNF